MKMEMDSAQESLYDQLDRLEQSLDSELLELQGLLQNPPAAETEGIESQSDHFFQSSCCDEVCIVKATATKDCNGETAYREVFYRRGSVCFQGEVSLDLQHAFDTSLYDIPVILSQLKQQESVFTQCDEKNDAHETFHELEKAHEFLISEITSEKISADIDKLDINWQLYFELIGETASLFPDVIFACSRFYSREYSFILLYFEGVFYATKMTYGEESLLDVDFSTYFLPRRDHEGSTLAMYYDSTWMKLSAWQRPQMRTSFPLDSVIASNALPQHEDLACDGYVQSYYILKRDQQDQGHEVMFRFGSWLYSGRIELPAINLQDIPIVIREMRLAQDKLNFVGDVSSLSAFDFEQFIEPMQCSSRITKFMKGEAAHCEVYLRQLLTEGQLSEYDSTTFFFEFECSSDTFESVELVCNKVYSSNGVIAISIYYKGSWYLLLEEANEEIPLLDSKFPELSANTNTNICQLKTYPRGHDSWAGLRKLSLWQTTHMNPADDKLFSVVSVSETKRQKHKYLRSLSLIPLRRKSKHSNVEAK